MTTTELRDIAAKVRLAFALLASVKLGLVEALTEDPREETLARRLKAHPAFLSRFIRYLEANGILIRSEGTLLPTELGERLSRCHPETMAHYLEFYLSPWALAGFTALDQAILMGRSAFSVAHDRELFDYLEQEKDARRIFDKAMTTSMEARVAALTDAWDFSCHQALLDVGGGLGKLISGILDHVPSLQGGLLDLPNVIDQARALPHPRLNLHEGSFFDDVPSGYDAHLLVHILHDWDDEDCVRILRKCREALPQGGNVLIVERLLDHPGREKEARDMDLVMMTLTTRGRERTREDFARLCEEASLILTKAQPTALSDCVLVAHRP